MIELNGMGLGDRIHHIRRLWGLNRGIQLAQASTQDISHGCGFRGKRGHSQLRGSGISGGAQLVETHLAPLLLILLRAGY